jgi:Peptidase family M50
VGFVGLIIAACLMQPLLVVLHELGHFITAQLLGLEASLISIGVGPKLWSGKILGVPLRIHAWPLEGFIYLGSRSMRLLRLRVWVTVLMGPATNIFLIAVTVILWNSLVRVIDANIIILWILYNTILVLGNLLPHRSRQSGHVYRSDGLQLLQIPFQKSADLAIYLSASSIVTAVVLFNDADYAGARAVASKGLERLPGNPWLSTTLSACQISLGEYEAAQAPEEALALLQYSNYERGTSANRSHRETARAFALRKLNRIAEADQAVALALRLNKIQPRWLSMIGVLPATRDV